MVGKMAFSLVGERVVDKVGTLLRNEECMKPRYFHLPLAAYSSTLTATRIACPTTSQLYCMHIQLLL
jgi:hypothetical protein